jgi:hypothetical protein
MTKTFMPSSLTNKLDRFVPGEPFQPVLIFASMVWRLPFGVRAPERPNVTGKYQDM